MTKKRAIILIGIILLIFLLVGEMYFLFVIKQQATIIQNIANIKPTSASNPNLSNTQNSFPYPVGFFTTSQNYTTHNLPFTYTLIAKLDDISLQKDKSILAHIDFAQDNGRGKMITQAIRISSLLIFTLQNDTILFPSDNHKKRMILKGSQQVLSTLSPMKGHVMIFTFMTYDPNPNDKPPSSGYDPQCNNKLLLALSPRYNPPSCLPITQNIAVYEKF